MTSTLSAGLSGGFVALAALFALLAWRDARKDLSGRILAALCLSVAALELTTGPLGDALTPWLRAPLRIVGGFNVALLWLFCLSILRDGFALRGFELGGFAVFSIGPLVNMVNWRAAPGAGVAEIVIALAPFLALSHVVWVAIAERRGDLVAGRHQSRVWLAAIIVVAAFVSVASEEIADPQIATMVRIGVSGLPVATILCLWLTALQPERLSFTAQLAPVTPLQDGPAIDPRDQALLGSLVQAMEAGLYREPGLTIEKLAETLKTPTHRLRAVINQGLGHRNFAAFLNGYRLAHAKAALADPARGRETVLAIAYEAGFAALQTFNRVFKEAEGDTPTSFREKRLREAAQNLKTPPNS